MTHATHDSLMLLQRTLALQRRLATSCGLTLLANFYSARRRDVLNLDLALSLQNLNVRNTQI